MRKALVIVAVLLAALTAAGAQPLKKYPLMVLVVGPRSKPPVPIEAELVARLNKIRSQANLKDLMLATMHFDQPAQAKLCRDVLGVTDLDLVCVVVAELDPKTRRPTRALYRVTNVTPETMDEAEKTIKYWASSSGVQLPPNVTQAINRRLSLWGLDFNGDQKSDVFFIKDGRWYVSYGASGTPAPLLQDPGSTLSTLLFGDFNGDLRTDVLTSRNGLRLSIGGTQPWISLNKQITDPVESLRVGDLDGDGRSDLFTISQGRWMMSSGGKTPWRQINSDPQSDLSSVALADFDGDGKCDVLVARNGQWLVSRNGTAPGELLNTQPDGISGLRLGDFNGDGKLDVLVIRRKFYWALSDGGTQPPVEINNDPTLTMDDLRVLDQNGDGKADLFSVKTLITPQSNGAFIPGRWVVSYGAATGWQIVNGDPAMVLRDLRTGQNR